MGSRVLESCVPKETESSKWDLGVRYVPQRVLLLSRLELLGKTNKPRGTQPTGPRFRSFGPLSGTLWFCALGTCPFSGGRQPIFCAYN